MRPFQTSFVSLSDPSGHFQLISENAENFLEKNECRTFMEYLRAAPPLVSLGRTCFVLL